MESEGGKREPQGEWTFCLTIARGIALCCVVFVCDSVRSHKDSLFQVYMVFFCGPHSLKHVCCMTYGPTLPVWPSKILLPTLF